MWNLIIEGGPGMFVILVFGALALATAAWFAWRVEGRVRGFLDGMGRAVLYAALTSACVDFGKVIGFVTGRPPEERGVTLMEGLGESLAPLILGFAVLALVHFLTAIGQRRLDGRRT